jgi:hypothetical protein
MLACLAVLLAGASAPAQKVCLVSFDGDTLRAERDDFGAAEPAELTGFALTPAGGGCPTNPGGRALDAGDSEATREGRLAFPIARDGDLRQGTLEMWFRPAWGAGERAIHMLSHIKLQGGVWNSIALVYHGTIGATSEAFGANIMDGLDHPAYVSDARSLGWKPGEWHHLALTWTEHSEYVFVDAKLVAHVLVEQPFRIRDNEGKLCLGCPHEGTQRSAAGLIDEVRFCDVPLYSPASPPDPTLRPGEDLGLGLATAGEGAEATADSSAPPHALEFDSPLLHDGQYGQAMPVGEPGKGAVTVYLPEEREVAGFEWSRDGMAYAGEGGRGFAYLLPWPLAFAVETTTDGREWTEAYSTDFFDVTPEWVGTHEALRFRQSFEPRRCRMVRMRILKGPRGDPMMQLDEVGVYGPDGTNLARLPGVRVETSLTECERRHDPGLAIDGRWGEESCWKSATRGKGTLTVELPRLRRLSRLVFSRSHEGLAGDGVPCAGKIEVSTDGADWRSVGEIAGAEAGPRTISFEPTEAKLIRLTITQTADGKEAVVDDLRAY